MNSEIIKALINTTPFGAFCLIILYLYRRDITTKYERYIQNSKEMYSDVILYYKTIINHYEQSIDLEKITTNGENLGVGKE